MELSGDEVARAGVVYMPNGDVIGVTNWEEESITLHIPAHYTFDQRREAVHRIMTHGMEVLT